MRLARSVVLGAVLGLCLVFLVEVIRIFLGGNFHAVIPGEAYRSAQLSPGTLKRVLREEGIQTVVNLRGCCASFAWYQNESRAVRDCDAVLEDVCLSSGRLPSAGEVRRLVEVIDRSRYPILLHCNRGIDRTGLAAAMVLLLRTETPLDEALNQLGFRYVHLNLGRTGYIDAFFVLYKNWLREHQQTHSAAVFRHWATEEYRPADCWARLEILSESPRLKRGRPSGLKVRATNISVEPWHFQPNRLAGVHARYSIHNQYGHCVATGHAGLCDATVPPGEGIDLTLSLPALSAGRYTLIIDLEHSGHCLFFQAGSEPLEQELIVDE